jgi:hypothetical protein
MVFFFLFNQFFKTSQVHDVNLYFNNLWISNFIDALHAYFICIHINTIERFCFSAI